MIDIKKANNDMKFDVRLIDTNLKKGLITKAEVEEVLANLEDLSSLATAVEVEDSSSADESEAVESLNGDRPLI